MADLIEREKAINAVCEEGCGMCTEAIKDISTAQPWTLCKDKLPEKEGYYLVYAPDYDGGSSSTKENHNGVMFSRYKNGKWGIEHGYYSRPGCVKAYMPLPEPIKEG